MSNRVYLKLPNDEIYLRAKSLGADYVEDGAMIFKIPKLYGQNRIALRMKENMLTIGCIKADCDNFEMLTGYLYQEETDWIIKMLTKLSPLLRKDDKKVVNDVV